MKCPHCQIEFHDTAKATELGTDKDGYWYLENRVCPACERLIVQLVGKERASLGELATFQYPGKETRRYFVRPRSSGRPAPPAEVPTEVAQDYIEASAILADSPKASAALSRRCLQHIIREHAGIKRGDLAKEIEALLNDGQLPSHLAEAIDAVRNIGNFAAHPIKCTASGEILPVEPGEAEWTLDVLDGLFDFYFVQPTLLKRKKDALNSKLASANKPAIK